MSMYRKIGEIFKKPVLVCPKGTRVKQSFKKDCDINQIVTKFRRTGTLSHVNKLRAMYGDFSKVPDYKGACDIVREAEENFNGLESGLRARFENDPGKFLEFCSNPENRAEMVKLGLIEPKANAAAKPSAEPAAPPVAEKK